MIAVALGVAGGLSPLAATAAPLPSDTTSEAEPLIVAGGMAAIDRYLPSTPGGYDDIDTTLTVTREPGTNGRTYWAHQWYYSGGGTGYMGLQQRAGTEKYVNFSIWNTGSWSDVSAGVHCRSFDHEGSGVQCDAPYAWQEGVTYRMTVERVDAGWRATIVNTSSGVATPLATIAAPSQNGISGLSEWVENFAQGADAHESCADVPGATAVYGVPTANSGAVVPTTSYDRTYGNCASIAKTVCTSEQICTLSVQQGTLPDRVKLQNVYSTYCLDLLGGGLNAGLWHCTNNANQIIGQSDTYRIAFSDRTNQCLTVASANQVGAAACNDSARQQWLYVPRTSAYFNPATGLCLDAYGGATLDAPVRAHTCLGNGYQQWRTVS